MSKIENNIEQLLIKEKITYKREKTFSDLKNNKFRYDFVIYKNNTMILLEYDSELHFKFIKKYHKTEQDFLAAKERDRIKNTYAITHNIMLLRVPYWEINNIKTFSDFFQEKFLVKSKWHNDFLITH